MASPVDTSVKFFRDDFPGAPVLNGVAGAAIALADALLLTGFGLRTASSVTVAGGVCTVALASDAKNVNLTDSVILVEGVTGAMAALNGEQKVTAAALTTLKFATALADGTATGTITVKTAPAGQWEKAFSATNVACYRSTDPMVSGAYLQMTDTGTTVVGVRMYESMSAVNTGANQAPTVVSAATAQWIKSQSANTNAVRWDVFADSRRILWCVAPESQNPATAAVGQTANFFGDILKYKSIDPYAVLLTTNGQVSGGYGSVFHNAQGGATQAPTRILRIYTGLGVAQQAWCYGAISGANVSSGKDSYLGAFPSVDGKIKLSPILVFEGAAPGSTLTVARGVVPGCYYVPMSGAGISLPRGTRIQSNGRTLYCVRAGDTSTSDQESNAGYGFVDITGPWGDLA